MEINYMRGGAPLFGSRPMYQTAAAPMMPAPATRPPAPTSAANLQALLALSGQDRANAFLKGLGAMGPALIAAGAPSTDPGAAQKNIALAGQLRAKTTQDDLARQRAANVQALSTQMALQKAAREQQLADMEIARRNQIGRMLGIGPSTPQAAGSSIMPSPAATTVQPSVTTPGSAAVPAPVSAVSPAAPRTLQFPRPVLQAALMSSKPGDIAAGYAVDIAKQRANPTLKFLDGELTGLGKVEQEDKLRVELKPVSTAFNNADRFFRIVDGQLQKGNGTADIAGLTAMVKMIDEGMVTVSETDLQRKAVSTKSMISNALAAFQSGELLASDADALRKNMRDTAKDLLRDMHLSHQRTVEGYKGISTRRKLNWQNVWTLGDDIFKKRRTINSNAQNPAPQTTPLPASRSNAPRVGSSSSRFTLPNQTN
tara:strand:+ start:4020 stop:5300 length:1281 start_codon:yes stop_codon:yes gene_type:complete